MNNWMTTYLYIVEVLFSDIIVSSSDEWENDSDDSEKESSGINQLTNDW